MNKLIAISIFFIILTAACSPTAHVTTEPPATLVSPDISPTSGPAITPTPAQPASTATSITHQLPGSLAVITTSNAQDLKKIAVLTGSTGKVTDLAFSGDGAYLASTGYEEKIRLWDINTWQEVYSFPLRGADLNAIAFSPDGSLLASAYVIWNVKTQEIVRTLEKGQVSAAHVAFSPDGSQLAVIASRTIKVWDVASWNELLAFDMPSDCRWLFGITFSPDGQWLAAPSGNGRVYFWSADTGQLAFTLEQDNERDVHDIAFTPDGTWLATGGTDYYARIWNVTNGEQLQKMSIIGMYSLALSPDGTLLATAGPSRRVELWDVQTGRMLHSLPHADELMAVAFSADGRLIAAGGYDNKIIVWGISP